MDRSKLIVGVAMVAVLGAGLYYLLRKRRTEIFGANSPLRVELAPYNGELKDNPNIKQFQQRFPELVQNAITQIQKEGKKQGWKELSREPPVKVTVTLDDSFDNEPFVLPSAATACPRVAYTKNGGNCRSYGIRLGAKALASNYKGRTTVDQIMTHELTHVHELFFVPNHDELPDHVIEGKPIFIAKQEGQIKKVQNSGIAKKDKNFDYKDGEIHVDTYGKLMDKFHEEYGV